MRLEKGIKFLNLDQQQKKSRKNSRKKVYQKKRPTYSKGPYSRRVLSE